MNFHNEETALIEKLAAVSTVLALTFLPFFLMPAHWTGDQKVMFCGD